MSHCCTLKTKRKNTMHHMSLWMWCWKENSRFPVKVSILEIMNIYSSDRPQWRVTRETMSGWKLHLTNEIFIASRRGRPHCGFINCIYLFFFVEVNDTNYDHWKWLLHNERGCGKTKDLDNGFLTCCHLGPNMQKMVKRSIWFAQRTITVDKGAKKPANTEEKENIILE